MNRKIILSFLIFLVSLLILRVELHFALAHQYHKGESIEKEVTILSEPKTSLRFQQISLVLDSGQSVLLSVNSSENLSYGDTIFIRSKLIERKIGEKIVLALNQPQITVKKAASNPLLAVLANIRQRIAAFYNSVLPQTSASLLLGIVFGIKENMPSDFSALLRTSGVTHVIAASGMNVTLIASFFAVVFGKFFSRRLALILTVLAIFIYALASGLSPSIIRASIMGTIAFSAQILGRQNRSLFALFLTAWSMIFVSPVTILDVGFQLSALSTLGILILNPYLEARLNQNPLTKIVGADLATTISAQIFTLPIILGTFGTYFLPSILVNLLVLWTVPVLMVCGALGAFLSFVFEPLAVLALFLSYPFLAYFESVVKTIGQLRVSFSLSYFPWQLGVGYYLILSAVLLKARK